MPRKKKAAGKESGRRSEGAACPEEALRAEPNLATAMIELAPVIIMVLDPEGRIVRFNPYMAAVSGYSLEEVKGRDWFATFLPEGDRERIHGLFGGAISGTPTRGNVNSIRTKDGRLREIEWFDRTLKDAEGRSTGLLVIGQDVTERMRTEEALRQSEERYRVLVEANPHGIQQIDVLGTITYANEAHHNMYGYEKGELIGRSITEFLSSEAQRRELPGYLELLVRDQPAPTVYSQRILTKEGKEKEIEVAWAYLRDEGGAVVGFLSVMTDVTERKRLGREMQQTQKLESLGVLAGGVAHDFNNLLMGIMGNADLALRQLSPVSPAQDNIAQVLEASHRAAELAGQMLAYSGRGRFVIEVIDLNELVKETKHLLRSAVSKKAVLKYELGSEGTTIEADATQMRQIAMNLVTNASEALDDAPGVITILTDVKHCAQEYLARSRLPAELAEGRYVHLTVADTGCGMDQAALEKIFDPFYTTKFMGRGLGLSAVLGIVRGHKGAILIESEPGKGTTFTVLFPASDRPAEERVATPGETGEPSPGGTVLLVDDEEIVRDVSTRMLEIAGYTVVTASDGAEAVDIFRERADEICCVLLDLTMPQMGGEETYDALRGIQKDVRVILSSSYTQQEVEPRSAGKGLAGFLQKPYKYEALARKVQDVVAM